MHTARRWWIALGVFAAAIACAGAALALWWPSDAELARAAEARASEMLGVPVAIGRLEWSLWPAPEVVLHGVRVGADAPITAARITARARWRQVLAQRELGLSHLAVDDATVPQAALSSFKPAAPVGAFVPPLGLRLADVPVAHAEWRELRWVGRQGRTLVYAGDVDFDPRWRPRRALLQRPGAAQATHLALAREGDEDRWQAEVAAGGRTEHGMLRLQEQPGSGDAPARYRIAGAIDFRQIDVTALLGAFGRRSAVAGKASGHTDVDAVGAGPGEIARSLHSRTRFSMAPATVQGFDLAAAVKSAGTHHGGTTPLDRLDGTIDTHGDRGGTIVRYTGLKATSGVLTASGDAVVQSRRIQGHVAVDLVDGIVGVPLEFGGTVSEPTLSLPAAAVAGAAIGTAIVPGIGTAIGARIGETLRRIFSGDNASPKAAPPPQARPAPRGR